jgi:hypothetical protein
MDTKREIVYWEKNSENEILCQSEEVEGRAKRILNH